MVHEVRRIAEVLRDVGSGQSRTADPRVIKLVISGASEPPMPSHPYFPLLVAVLRRTLAEIEGDLGLGANDEILNNLKVSILRILARIEGLEPEKKPRAVPSG